MFRVFPKRRGRVNRFTSPVLQQIFNKQGFICIIEIICPEFFKSIYSDRKFLSHYFHAPFLNFGCMAIKESSQGIIHLLCIHFTVKPQSSQVCIDDV